MRKNFDFNGFEFVNKGKLTEAKVSKATKFNEIFLVTIMNESCVDVELDENTTIAKAWKAMKAKSQDSEKEECTITYWCENQYGDKIGYEFDLVD
jgi:hypothetical protein